MQKYSVFVNEVWQGYYVANSVSMAVTMYCLDYQTTRNEIAKMFGVIPKAFIATNWEK